MYSIGTNYNATIFKRHLCIFVVVVVAITFTVVCAVDSHMLTFGSIHASIGTILCGEHWGCLSSLLGYWT